MPNKFSLEEFIQEARSVHGERYGYDLLSDSSLNKKHTFVCTKHGDFHQYGFHHLGGAGCKQCGIERRSGRTPKTHSFLCHDHGPQTISVYLLERRGEQCPKCIDKSLSSFKKYRQRVRAISERWWLKNPNLIDPNPSDKIRSKTEYHLDHIFSVYDGYRLKIDPHIIGHWTNLMLIDYKTNIRKGHKSWRSKETLISIFEDWKNP